MKYYKSRNSVVKAVRFLNLTASILDLDEMLDGVTVSYRIKDTPRLMLSGDIVAYVGDWVVQKGDSVFVLSNDAFTLLFKEE